MYELACSGNEACIEILENTGSVIGIGLTNLIHILNPNKIVLGGGVMKSAKFILPAIRESIGQRALTPQAKKAEVVVSELGDDATISGAVALILVDFFDPA